MNLGLAALLPAFGAGATWFCCLPIAAGTLGMGAAAFGTALTPVRPYLSGLALVLLGFAFYRSFRPRAGDCGPEACEPVGRRWPQRLVLVGVTLVTGLLLTVERWSPWVIYWLL